MISVIITVLNEGESIRRLMDSLVAQTQAPDEVVIVDGGSRDNTVAILREYESTLPLRVLVEPGANISVGRNHAIDAAQGDIIAVTGIDPDLLSLREHRLPLPRVQALSQRLTNLAGRQRQLWDGAVHRQRRDLPGTLGGYHGSAANSSCVNLGRISHPHQKQPARSGQALAIEESRLVPLGEKITTLPGTVQRAAGRQIELGQLLGK